MRYLYAFILASALAATGCSTFLTKVLPVITDIITAVVDAERHLDLVERAAQAYFKERPDADMEKRVTKALQTTRMSLNVALKDAHEAKAAGEASYDDAFQEFRSMYGELVKLLKELGVVGSDDTLAAGPYTGIKLEPPLALQSRGEP